MRVGLASAPEGSHRVPVTYLAVSALTVTLMGRPGDAVTAVITTAVVMVVAAVNPRNAWQQPILRFADPIIGVAVGVAAAWIGLRLTRPPANQARALKARPSTSV